MNVLSIAQRDRKSPTFEVQRNIHIMNIYLHKTIYGFFSYVFVPPGKYSNFFLREPIRLEKVTKLREML